MIYSHKGYKIVNNKSLILLNLHIHKCNRNLKM